MIVKEHIDFQRGRDPKQSMDIGLFAKINKITSEDLAMLKVYTDNGDGKGHENEELFLEIYESALSPEKYLARVKEVYKLLEPYEYLFGDSFETDMKKEIKNYARSYLKNPRYNFAYDCGYGDEEVDVFFCEIELPAADKIMGKNIREDLNFERGQDPKKIMGIGIKEKIYQGILGLLKSSRSSSTKISTINLLKNREDLWLEISDYGTKDFEDVFYSFLSPEYFKDDIYVKAKPRKFSKSWKNDWKVFIKDEYKEFFKDCFNQEGFIKESLNFERGGDPLDRMDIGRVKERKLKIIDEITKYEPDPWQGSSVLAKYLTRRGKFPIGWDVPMLEDDSMENLKYALEYLRKWEQVEKKQAEQRQRNFIDSKKSNESLDFERGQDPKKAMEIGWGDMLIRNIQEDEEGYTYNVNNKEIEKILRKNIPSINDNEVSRFFNSTLEEILDHISVIDLGKKDYKHISDFIKREIESNSRWWMDLHSDAAMRQIARNSGMKI